MISKRFIEMDSQMSVEDSADLFSKNTGLSETDEISAKNSNVSVAHLNSKDELNWVENEIVIVDSMNNKIIECSDIVGNSNDSTKVADVTIGRVSNCKTTNDENEIKLWEYFTKHNSSQLRCKLCLGLFLYQSNASHLLRHVEVAHDVPVLANDKSVEGTVASVDLKAASNTVVDRELTVDQSQELSADKDSCKSMFLNSGQKDVVGSSKLSDKVHEYFTRLESGKMRCNLCCRMLSYDSDKSTIFRHLHSNHGDTYRFIIESTSCKDHEFANSENASDISLAGLVTQNKTKKKKKVICIGEYFTEVEDSDRVKCKFCKAVLKYSEGVAKNLVKHLESKHKDMLFKKDLISVPKTKEPNSTLILEILQVDDRCLITNAQLQIESTENATVELTNTDSYESISQPNRPTPDDQRELFRKMELNQNNFSVVNVENENLSEVINSEIKIGENNQEILWNYFTKLHSIDSVKCNICSNVIKSDDSTKRLNDHLLTNHGIDLPKPSRSCNSFQFETFVSETSSHTDENLNFEYELKNELTVKDVTNINLSSILHSEEDNCSKMIWRKPKRKVNLLSGRLWKYFTKLHRGKAICNICNRAVSYKLCQFSYLVKHLQMHYRFVQRKSDNRTAMRQIRSKKVNKSDIVWKFFTKLGNSKVECNLCEHINVQYYSSCSRSKLMKHLRRKHKYFLDLYRDNKNKRVNDEGTITDIITVSDKSTDERSIGIDMKTLFAYFSSDTSLQKWIKFENDQIICKLCTGMFICDNLLNFGSTMKRHVQSCHEFAFISQESADTSNSLSSDNDDEPDESETDERLEIISNSSYNELEAISKEISSFIQK